MIQKCPNTNLEPPLYKLVDDPVGEIAGGDLIFLRGGPSSGPKTPKIMTIKTNSKKERKNMETNRCAALP